MVDLETISIREELLKLIPRQMAVEKHILPLELKDGTITVALAEGYSFETVQDLEFMLGKIAEVTTCEIDVLDKAIRRLYGVSELEQSKLGWNGIKIASSDSDLSSDGSVVGLVSSIISDAVKMGASDIHVEPYEKLLRVRYRLDGVLHDVLQPPFDKTKALISRLKILSDLDIAEKRRPQDGRMRVKHGVRTIDIRVSTLPTDFGEKVVLRILDKSAVKLDLDTLGFEEEDLKLFKKTIQLPYGMILVTGPTGSGKTTTLYSALNYINSPELNIVTIEDPIEYNLPGINQTHVRSDIGLTFAAALRSILRQDPDVIMVGEIRDKETAEIAIRAALTGHLVFSTLHTNDAPSAITRLIDMGVEPFLVASSVKMILAQRLLRRLCPECRQEEHLDPQTIADLGLSGISQNRHWTAKGCPHCSGIGYRGRIAVYELLPVENSIAELIAHKFSMQDLRSLAVSHGYRSLRDAALAHGFAGRTTISEVLRETT